MDWSCTYVKGKKDSSGPADNEVKVLFSLLWLDFAEQHISEKEFPRDQIGMVQDIYVRCF